MPYRPSSIFLSLCVFFLFFGTALRSALFIFSRSEVMWVALRSSVCLVFLHFLEILLTLVALFNFVIHRNFSPIPPNEYPGHKLKFTCIATFSFVTRASTKKLLCGSCLGNVYTARQSHILLTQCRVQVHSFPLSLYCMVPLRRTWGLG